MNFLVLEDNPLPAYLSIFRKYFVSKVFFFFGYSPGPKKNGPSINGLGLEVYVGAVQRT